MRNHEELTLICAIRNVPNLSILCSVSEDRSFLWIYGQRFLLHSIRHTQWNYLGDRYPAGRHYLACSNALFCTNGCTLRINFFCLCQDCHIKRHFNLGLRREYRTDDYLYLFPRIRRRPLFTYSASDIHSKQQLVCLDLPGMGRYCYCSGKSSGL